MKIPDVGFLLLGLGMCLGGVFFIFNRGYVSGRFGYVDLGPFHYLFGLGILCIGAVAVFHELDKLFRK